MLENITLFATQRNAELAEKLEQLMPSVWIMVATLGALCFLLVIMTFFVYNPVKKMVQNRKDFIQKNIDESINVKENAYNLENEARLKLEESKNISSEIISQAKIEAEMIKKQYIEQGKNESDKLIKEAKQNIELTKRNLENDSYDEIVSVAMEISKKIIKEKISEKEAKKYLNEYLGK